MNGFKLGFFLIAYIILVLPDEDSITIKKEDIAIKNNQVVINTEILKQQRIVEYNTNGELIIIK